MTLAPHRQVHFCEWEAYPWNNELHKQFISVESHFNETLDEEYAGAHSPLHMFERAIALLAFSIRRLVEKRLLKDTFREVFWTISSFPATKDYRPPFVSQTGGQIFKNYNFDKRIPVEMRAGDIANEIIHSSQLSVLADKMPRPGTGILVASDRHMRHRILHLPIDLLREIVERTIDNTATKFSDEWDPKTNTVKSRRD